MNDITQNPCSLRNAIEALAQRAIPTFNDTELEWLTSLGDLAMADASDLSEMLTAIACADYDDEIGHPWESTERFTAFTMHLAASLEKIATMGEIASSAQSAQKLRAHEAGKLRKSSRARSTEESSEGTNHA
ncbi:hypothetical protein [Paraburkholderia adhaesiva]|uniref:hypothetical protein n=1 Tax=Paraburkholderia adhaesiva TaxID=2883244 RepID=UPI001F4561DF|nr:hypothetical protein [Paraburkholderia adhaesiva]